MSTPDLGHPCLPRKFNTNTHSRRKQNVPALSPTSTTTINSPLLYVPQPHDENLTIAIDKLAYNDSLFARVLSRYFQAFLNFRLFGKRGRELDTYTWGGGVYIQNLLLYIRCRVTEETESSLFFLDVVAKLLRNRIR